MRNHAYPESAHTASNAQVSFDTALANSGLPNRLMTAFEVAEFVGCHEETVRRAYLRGVLVSQRFGMRSRRFHCTGAKGPCGNSYIREEDLAHGHH